MQQLISGKQKKSNFFSFFSIFKNNYPTRMIFICTERSCCLLFIMVKQNIVRLLALEILKKMLVRFFTQTLYARKYSLIHSEIEKQELAIHLSSIRSATFVIKLNIGSYLDMVYYPENLGSISPAQRFKSSQIGQDILYFIQ